MTLRKLILFYTLAVLFQLSVVNLFSVGGITPHLVFCLTVAITFIYEEGYRCIPFALLSMIFVDICGAQYAGMGALALLATGALVLFFRRELNVEQWAPLVVTGILATVVYHLVYWVILKLMGEPMEMLYLLKQVGFYSIYNTVLLAIFFVLMSRHKKKRDSHRYDI